MLELKEYEFPILYQIFFWIPHIDDFFLFGCENINDNLIDWKKVKFILKIELPFVQNVNQRYNVKNWTMKWN